MENRPKGVVIVAIIMFFAACMALIVGISLLLPGTFLDVLWTLNPSVSMAFTPAGIILGSFLLILGLIIMSTVFGLLKGRKWAWWTTAIIFVANGIGDAVRITSGGIEGIAGGIFGILIAVGFLFYLTRPEVRAFFEK